MNSVSSIISSLKEDGQDYEWYPTTSEMAKVVFSDMVKNKVSNGHYDILDIGAGNGNLFTLLKSYVTDDSTVTCYAIEKSEKLINLMPKDVFVVGTDFHQQSLIDKHMDIIFCNPPYSEYADWVEKIISEANSELIFLVIPQRWSDNKSIDNAIKRRDAESTILGSFSFEDSEYRKARAKVDIVKIALPKYMHDPFDNWFNDTFIFEADKVDNTIEDDDSQFNSRINTLVKSKSLIESLSAMYMDDMNNLYENYRAVERLDSNILEELGVDKRSLRSGMKLKIKGLKDRYWNELFSNLGSITDRLTSSSRKTLLQTLSRNTSIDFTASNIYAVVIWAIKNANDYFDKQLLDVYFRLTSTENITGYKSNKRFLDDDWRNIRDYDFRQEAKRGERDRYKLEYRLVLECYKTFNRDSFGDYDYPCGLSKTGHEYINDLFTIAKNLGFNVDYDSFGIGEWEPGTKEVFTYDGGKRFAEIRCYKNGNIHYKLCKEFMLAFNVEAGRLNGWLKDPEHAKEELRNKDAGQYFSCSIKLLPTEGVNLIGLKP